MKVLEFEKHHFSDPEAQLKIFVRADAIVDMEEFGEGKIRIGVIVNGIGHIEHRHVVGDIQKLKQEWQEAIKDL